MKHIFLVADHAGFELKEELKNWLEKSKTPYTDLYPNSIESDDYPDSANLMAAAMKKDPKSIGLAFCGTGQGIMIALNRNNHIRAVIHDKREIVRLTRSHNDANVLCYPARFTHRQKAISLAKVFINTPFSKEERHLRRVGKLKK